MQTPQSNLIRITTVMNAWENLRPGKSFGMTLAEYQKTVKPSLDSRKRIAELEALLVAERATRDGADGAVYVAMGFVRASENQWGLVRRVGRRNARAAGKRHQD